MIYNGIRDLKELKIITPYHEVVKDRRIPKTLHYCSLKDTFPNIDPESDIKRVIAMSDLHGATTEIIDDLIKKGRINKSTLVITTGDMGGSGKMGGKHDPYEDYKKILDTSHSFYFVQGNHDKFGYCAMEMINDDKSRCCVHESVVDTPIGRIGGVNGIIAYNAPDPTMHIYEEKEYHRMMINTLKQTPEIFLSHQPLEKYSLRGVNLHLFGHAHFHDYVDKREPSLRINMDGRIFQWD